MGGVGPSARGSDQRADRRPPRDHARQAKFHVSEILGKLGVESRQEAARWAGRQRVLRTLGLAGVLLHKLTSIYPGKLAGGAVIAAVAIGLGALAAGVFLTDSDPAPQDEATAATSTPSPSPTPESLTGNAALDALVESLVEDDEGQLVARFGGVSARQGQFIGGPIGLYQATPVSTADWTARLGAAERTLLGVVDPREPADPADISGLPGEPSTPMYDGQRDYDIVLLATEAAVPERLWRFSVLDATVVDVIMEVVEQSDDLPDLFPLPYRLYQLMPSPDEEPHRFVVLPPKGYWPIPDRVDRIDLAPSGNAPSIAPDGRTNDPELNAAIELLLNAGASMLEREAGDVAARLEVCIPDPVVIGTCRNYEERLDAADWIRRFVSSERTLYAVLNRDPFDVIIAGDRRGFGGRLAIRRERRQGHRGRSQLRP